MATEASRMLRSNPDDDRPLGRLRVHLLGRFSVSVDGRPVPDAVWRQRRAASIVKLLALESSHRLHREQLMELLWPDLDYAAQLNNLRQALHHARRGLEAAGMPPGLALERDGDTVVLAPAGLVWVDAQAFEQAVGRAWQALTPDAAQDAIALYGGDVLPDDLYEEWGEQRRTALRASYLALLARLASLHGERGAPGEATGVWQQLTSADPTNEAAHVALMRLYAGSGQRQQALAQFDQLVAILERDLDASPEPASWDLADAIRDGHFLESSVSGSHSGMAPASTNSLPTPLSRLVGRAQEQAELRQLLASERLLTLTGPGGIGKTRLALAVAHAVADTFPDGVAFVDLAPVRDPERVLPAIAGILGVREASGELLESTLATALRGKRLLLVLDNVEQVVAAGRKIASLLEQAPSLKALVTSRIRMRIRGEREYPVAPLAVAEHDSRTVAPAIVLFVARARDVQPGFALSPANSAIVAAICRQLDGLPLAIELAAARSRILSPRGILDRLEQPLALLAAGASDLPERQQTIRATIQWSYDLLDPAEQILFARLSVFAGGWTLDAAEAVVSDAGPASDVLDGLDSLSSKSLLTQRAQPDVDIRFVMLATIRKFGLERLAASGEDARIRDRHAAWVVRLVEQAEPHLESDEQARWLERLGHDNENFRSALAWLHERRHTESALRLVRGLRLHWFARGWLKEGYEHLIAVASLPESAAYPTLQADVLTAAGYMAREMGDYEHAYQATRASLTISHQIHDRKRAADGLANLGYIALQQGQTDDARSILQRSLTTNRELHNEQGVADTLGFLALTDLQTGELDLAAHRLTECITIWQRLDDHQGVAWAHAQRGFVRLEQAAYPAAWDDLMTSLTISQELDFRWGIFTVLDGLARLALIHGQPVLAVRLAAAATSLREEAGIRLSPVEQVGVDRLMETLRQTVGTRAIDDAWAKRSEWTLDALRQEIEDALANGKTS
ncbi:MAG: AAA family ATPase [Chloroflexota bacterium]|nr:AAA family ATPase [Chloroflexota bacterium]